MTGFIPRVLVSIPLVLFALLPAVAAQTLNKVTDSVYAYTDIKNASPSNSFGANAGIIIGENSVAVVDTLASAKLARKMIQDIKQVTPKPIRYVINTHTHFDHCLGNIEFTKLGAVVISHEAGRAGLMRVHGRLMGIVKSMGMTDDMLEGTVISYPSMTFKNKMTIDLGNLLVELYHNAPGHSPDNILVTVPKEKVLFTGDILFTDFHPFIGSADVSGWRNNLDYIMNTDVTKIIPGHGPLSGKKDVADLKKYLILFDVRARKLCATSKDLDEISAQMAKILPQKAQGGWMIRSSLQLKYFKSRK